MIKAFKFLSTKRPVFQFEVLNNIQFYPQTLVVHEHWSLQRTELVKEWLSDCFFGTHPNGFDKTRYFPEIDRTCMIIQTGIDYSGYREQFFTAIIQIVKSPTEYVVVNLQYPTAHILYL